MQILRIRIVAFQVWFQHLQFRPLQLHVLLQMATVIVGTGIIGCATAYYLSQEPSSTAPSDIHLVESSPELFASASGFAAGFLAKDWFSPAAAPLGSLSFELHRQLAEENDGAENWGYSKSRSSSLSTTTGKRGYEWLREDASRAEAAAAHESLASVGPSWLSRVHHSNLEMIGDSDTTAQVYVSRH